MFIRICSDFVVSPVWIRFYDARMIFVGSANVTDVRGERFVFYASNLNSFCIFSVSCLGSRSVPPDFCTHLTVKPE